MSRRSGIWSTTFGAAAVAILLLAVVGSGSIAAAQPQGSAEEQLAGRFAPIVYLKDQDEPCDTDGEPFFPAPVEVVLGDATVVLKSNATDSGSTDPVVAEAPTAQELARSDASAYLDFPGNPRAPRCDYETYFKQRSPGLTPTVYAHIVPDEEMGKLALQYWFFYPFNDFNNTHESDWEMIQLVFDTTSVDEALTQEPVLIGFAQHGGGELAKWQDTKLQREGDHPIVYQAAGSHASYFGSNVYLGWGENGTGFGCDDTTGPSTRVPLHVVLVPSTPDASSPEAWALFPGRWGERQPWEFDGPKGPNLGKKWADPMGAISDWRPSSMEVPAQDTIGPTATDTFCTLSAAGSKLLIWFGVYPWISALLGLVAVAGPALLLFASRGVLGHAVAIYRAHWRTFLSIGVFTIPIGWIFNGFAVLLAENPPVEWMVQLFNDTPIARLLVALLVGVVQQAAMLMLVAPAVIQACADMREGRDPGVWENYREAIERFRPLGSGLLRFAIVPGVLAFTLIGLPLAIWLGVRWQFFGQAIILNHASNGRDAIRLSSDAVRGRWLKTFGATLAFQLVAAIPGPLIGILLLIMGGSSVRLANGVSSIIYAVVIPITVIALTLVYLRLTGQPGIPIAERQRDAPAAGPGVAPV
ncbi:MAG: hypothetical protein AB7R89_03900 [Dehalococcoidia bacterium]